MPLSIFRYAIFNVDALCQLANSLRFGRWCTCDVTQVPVGGSLYWAVFVLFDDGVEWVFRSPRYDSTIRSAETIQKLVASEAATLRYINSHSAIPVPEVYAYSVGVPYILMSKAKGSPLSTKWNSRGSQKSALSLKEKAKVLSQLGSITWQLSQLRFEEIGSLFEEGDGHFQVGSCLSRGLVDFDRDSLNELPRGPFSCENEYVDALVSAFLQHTECLQLHHHCFFAPLPTRKRYDDDREYRRACEQWNNFITLGSKIDGSDNRTDYVIVGHSLRAIASKWTMKGVTAGPQHTNLEFALHHPDLNVNNIFVDDDCRITCIIDWAFCSSVPLSVLLMAPGLPQSRDELEAPLIAAFEDGLSKSISTGDTILSKLRGFPSHRFLWLFYRLVSFDSSGDYSQFEEIWRLSDQNNLDFSTFFQSQQRSDSYIKKHEEMKQDDEPVDCVMRREAAYFQRDMVGLTVSRKLTLVSEWTSRYRKNDNKGIRRSGSIFVADDRLWKWILRSLEQAEGLE
ncbi:protein kinase subdomain-containing protein [Trichophyton tonsurans CBS 112818]|uniref:Protein kinase subdomain-containing protein n=1 Tax=Trichophyton tonsurans (strain CBS 112818) TaxID=647933 RepID=F2RP94_TRIT1|nr:protein kinase subdomain-containing protein [Trichophyton tonsurans CBS 112818]